MPFIVNHIHLKSADPSATAQWFCDAFNMTVTSDVVRAVGDRFIRTMTEGGLAINISGARTGETLGPADDSPHLGLEHFGFDTADIEADIARLVAIGAVLKEGPVGEAPAARIAFIGAPGGIRIELIQPASA